VLIVGASLSVPQIFLQKTSYFQLPKKYWKKKISNSTQYFTSKKNQNLIPLEVFFPVFSFLAKSHRGHAKVRRLPPSIALFLPVYVALSGASWSWRSSTTRATP
jgi:hypothetical protein